MKKKKDLHTEILESCVSELQQNQREIQIALDHGGAHTDYLGLALTAVRTDKAIKYVERQLVDFNPDDKSVRNVLECLKRP